MATILKPLFEVLTGNVAVMDNVLYNYIFLLLVGEIAFRVAWSFVGDLYRIGVMIEMQVGPSFIGLLG